MFCHPKKYKHLPPLTRTSSSNYCIMYSILVKTNNSIRTITYTKNSTLYQQLTHLCHVFYFCHEEFKKKESMNDKNERKLFKSHENISVSGRILHIHLFLLIFSFVCATWKWMAFCIFIIIIILAWGNHILNAIHIKDIK